MIFLFFVSGLSLLSSTQATAICNVLVSMRIVLLEKGRGDINRRVRLNVTKDNIYFALKEKI